jgi:hypothetical protein
MLATGPFQFRDQWYSWAPPWLRTGDAERYMYTLELCRDLLCEKMNEAMRIRIPGLGDPSQIPYLAFDANMVQGPAETNATFLARITASDDTWGLAGSRIAILEELQAYFTGLQPGVTQTLPQMLLVGGSYSTVATWDLVRFNTPSIALANGVPEKTTIMPSNYDWDGTAKPWRSWLVLFMPPVATGLSGSSAQTTTASSSLDFRAASFQNPGQNVGGVWVPQTTGTPVNAPWITVTGLTGLTTSNVNDTLTVSGSANPGNNGTFLIVQVLSATSCVIANPAGVGSDTGPLTWSIASYPYIGPGPVWGSLNTTFGQGLVQHAPIDTGSNVNGVWQPTTASGPTTISWGLETSSLTLPSIRSILTTWKSGPTYYESIPIVFDGGTGLAGSAYSPLSTPGSGNPDGTFGGRGKNVGGVWVPTRLISSSFDAYAQGSATGWYQT